MDSVVHIVELLFSCLVVVLIKFTGRLLNSVSSEYRDKIEDFITVFTRFRESLDRGMAVETLFVSTKALALVEETGEYMSLDLHC
jgi:hypothetical protein